MIIIYSKEDIKSLMLKLGLLYKDISFLSLKMKKAERDSIESNLDLIGETCLIDTLRNIEDEYASFEEIDYEHQSNNINKILKKKNSTMQLKIEDTYISLLYLNDKCGSQFYPFDKLKKFPFKENEKKIYEKLILPYLEIEHTIMEIIGIENFYKVHSRGIAKKKTKIIKSNPAVLPLLTILEKEIIPVLNLRIEEKYLFYKFITIADIFLLSLFYRLNLFDLIPDDLKNRNKIVFSKIWNLTNSDIFKKAALNKYNKHTLR